MDMNLEARKIACGYSNHPVLNDISLTVGSGEILCLLGPNGVGKTTLFKSILGLLTLQGGGIFIDGESVEKWSRKQLAQVIGYVPQVHTPPFPFSVLDVVIMGRISHMGPFSSPTEEDRKMAEENLERLEISYLKDRVYTEISGGERQMVLIARALTQNPKILVMDEPTSNLDFGNQVRVLKQVNRLASEGIAVIMTSHFPDHAFLCSSKVGLLQKDSSFLTGNADEIITEENLKNAYGIDVRVISVNDETVGKIKSCVPLVPH